MRLRAGRFVATVRAEQVVFALLIVVFVYGAATSHDVPTATALGLAAISFLVGFNALRETRLTRAEEARRRRLERLERIGQLIGELGERIADASTRKGTLWWALAAFTQRKLLVALAAVSPEELELTECRSLIEFEVDAKKAQRIYDGTRAALVEVATAIESIR